MSIEAMKQALEALEWNLPVVEDWGGKDNLSLQHKAITALRQAIEKSQKQNIESIALEALEHFYSYGFDRVTCERAIVAIKESLPQLQRQQWIGLTEKDKQTSFDNTQEGGGFWEFADAIEATLRRKNHG